MVVGPICDLLVIFFLYPFIPFVTATKAPNYSCAFCFYSAHSSSYRRGVSCIPVCLLAIAGYVIMVDVFKVKFFVFFPFEIRLLQTFP